MAAGGPTLSTSATAAGRSLWWSRCTLPGGPLHASHTQLHSYTQPRSRRYAYGCNLFLSIVRPPELARHSLGSSRLRFVPVFSSDADLDRFARLYGHASVAHGMVVSVGKDIGARSIATQLTSNAPAVRQLVLKWRLPSVTTAPHRPAWLP